MGTELTGTNEASVEQTDIDPWAAAFEALEQNDKGDAEGDTAAGSGEPGTGVDVADSGGAGEGEVVSDTDEAGDGDAAEGNPGGPGAVPGIAGTEDDDAFAGDIGLSEEEVKNYRAKVEEEVRTKAINDVAGEFVKRGVRNQNGVLGATLDDKDICQRDEDGVPHFYNPETGREFTGDNPRRQAQEWVDDYNKELARVFNKACAEYEKHLMDERQPALRVMEFKPKYEKLDPIRKGMLDNVIQDYEVRDKGGKLVGYSCDLDKALALVERQVAMIQEYAKSHGKKNEEKPSGPALDMKTSSGAMSGGEQHAPKSLAEAMEIVQNRQLEKLKK